MKTTMSIVCHFDSTYSPFPSSSSYVIDISDWLCYWFDYVFDRKREDSPLILGGILCIKEYLRIIIFILYISKSKSEYLNLLLRMMSREEKFYIQCFVRTSTEMLWLQHTIQKLWNQKFNSSSENEFVWNENFNFLFFF